MSEFWHSTGESGMIIQGLDNRAARWQNAYEQFDARLADFVTCFKLGRTTILVR